MNRILDCAARIQLFNPSQYVGSTASDDSAETHFSSTTSLEIGPGLGALSFSLWEKNFRFEAVDKDPILSKLLQEILPELPLKIGDALETLESFKSSGNPLHLVFGSLPYYITTELILSVCEITTVKFCVFIVQKEYAQRASAKECESSLTVFLKNRADVDLVQMIGASCFYPKPEVDSAVLLMKMRETPHCDPETLTRVLRKMYSSKRKMIRSSLKQNPDAFTEEILEHCVDLKIDMTRRAEDLDFETYFELARRIK